MFELLSWLLIAALGLTAIVLGWRWLHRIGLLREGVRDASNGHPEQGRRTIEKATSGFGSARARKKLEAEFASSGRSPGSLPA